MKALVYTKPRTLEFTDWPDPELEAGDALVRIRAASVCGSDLHGWLGESRGRVPPLVLGHEMAGEVVEVRDRSAAVQAGDRVAVYPIIACHQCSYCSSGRDYLCRRRKLLGLHVQGGFAEYLKVPARNLVPLPERTSFREGALVEPLACGLHAAELAAHDGGPAAILGAGSIGLLTLQAARKLKFPRIAVVEVNAARAEQARRQGADLTVNPKDPDCLEQLERFFGEDGCSVVFDAAGFSATRKLALGLVRPGGLIVSVGLGEQESPLDFVDLVRGEVRIQGVFAYSRRNYEQAAEWIAGGHANLQDWVSDAPLAEGQSVFEELAGPNASRIKVVLNP